MNDDTRATMNAKIEVLFAQIAKLEGDNLILAAYAVELWRSAKVQEYVGMGPMETLAINLNYYESLQNLGLEIGGMLKPYERV